ncbi:MAG: YgaP family membrane protein [Pseudohongiellaceae bacterium]
MITNVGLQDRLIRMTIGLFFLIIGLNNGITTLWGIILAVVGLVAVVTGAVSFCPAYYERY